MLIDASPAHASEAEVLDLDLAVSGARDLGGPAPKSLLPSDVGASASMVSDYIAPAPGRHLPHMLLATTVVAVLPLAASLALRASGRVSGWVSVGLAVVMSLVASTAGSAYWRKRGGHGEVLFGELLIWGWIRRWRQERELASATRLLNLAGDGSAPREQRDELSVDQREHLLHQLAGALEGQDVYLNGHSRRVARHATMIARGMGLPNEDVARVRAAAAVHDVGKLLTPKAVLNKPGRLTDGEFEVIERHPVDGAEMVAALGDPELTRIVRHHHERLDGGGYPDRLTGENIPLGARIIAVADTFDAITSARPYRDAAPHQKAIDILRNEAGTQLDPDAVRAFLAYYSGSRPTVVWAILSSFVRRLVSWLTGDPAAAATISASKVAAATAATAAIGAAAAAAPVPVAHHARPVAHVVHLGHVSAAHRRGVVVGSPRLSGSTVPTVVNAAPGKAVTRAAARTGGHRGKTRTAGARRGARGRGAANHAGKHANSARATAGASSSSTAGSSPSGVSGSPVPPSTTSAAAVTPASSAPPQPVSAAAPMPPGQPNTFNANGPSHAPARPAPAPAHPAPAHPAPPAPPPAHPAPAHPVPPMPPPAHPAPAHPAPPTPPPAHPAPAHPAPPTPSPAHPAPAPAPPGPASPAPGPESPARGSAPAPHAAPPAHPTP
jgi:putative nucleotidyltransferase with HDIG domain